MKNVLIYFRLYKFILPPKIVNYRSTGHKFLPAKNTGMRNIENNLASVRSFFTHELNIHFKMLQSSNIF